MKRFVVVAIASIVILASVFAHAYAIGLMAGIVVGTWYFLQAVSRGGLAQARITRDPSEPRKPGDPDGSIGMGLAASGIAVAVIGQPDYAPYRAYFVFFFVAGMLIALAYAGKPVITELRERRSGADSESGSDL